MTTEERLQIAEKELSEIIAKWRESAAKVSRLREQNYRENANFLGGLDPNMKIWKEANE